MSGYSINDLCKRIAELETRLKSVAHAGNLACDRETEQRQRAERAESQLGTLRPKLADCEAALAKERTANAAMESAADIREHLLVAANHREGDAVKARDAAILHSQSVNADMSKAEEIIVQDWMQGGSLADCAKELVERLVGTEKARDELAADRKSTLAVLGLKGDMRPLDSLVSERLSQHEGTAIELAAQCATMRAALGDGDESAADQHGFGVLWYLRQASVLYDGNRTDPHNDKWHVEHITELYKGLKGALATNAGRELLDRLATAERERDDARAMQYRPIGDNHHNAALCPHCGEPLRKALAEIERLTSDLHDARNNQVDKTGEIYLENERLKAELDWLASAAPIDRESLAKLMSSEFVKWAESNSWAPRGWDRLSEKERDCYRTVGDAVAKAVLASREEAAKVHPLIESIVREAMRHPAGGDHAMWSLQERIRATPEWKVGGLDKLLALPAEPAKVPAVCRQLLQESIDSARLGYLTHEQCDAASAVREAGGLDKLLGKAE